MVRQKIDRHHRRIGQIRDLVDAGHRRHHCSPADIEENALGCEPLAAYLDLARREKPGMPAVKGDVRCVLEGRGQPVARPCHDRILARLDLPHIDADFAGDRDPVIGRTPRQLCGIGARHQRLCRRAAGIDAGAADEIALDDRDLHPGAGKAERQ